MEQTDNNSPKNRIAHHVDAAMQELKQQKGKRFAKQTHSSWVLLIGNSQGGKTAFITHSQHYNKITTPSFDLWISDHLVVIDPIKLTTADDYYTFAKRLKKYRGKECINQIALCLSVNLFTQANKNDREPLQNEISASLHTLAQQTKTRLPLTVVITQCDRISGFNAYFDDLSAEDRSKQFGFALTASNNSIEHADNLFNQLIEAINTDLIRRLHHQQNIDKRSLIQCFPLQIQQLKQALFPFINALILEKTISFRGIYLTSSQQSQADIDFVSPHLAELTETVNHLTTAHTPQQRAFFIAAILQHFIDIHSQLNKAERKQARNRLFAYPVLTAIIVGFVLLWHHAYQHSTNIIRHINKSLQQPLPQNGATEIYPWLARLDQLATTLKTLHPNNKLAYRLLGLNQGILLKHQTSRTYQSLLENTLMPIFARALAEQIQQGISGNKFKLYQALKIYLMLQNKKHYRANQVKEWFTNYWQQQYPNNTLLQSKLATHLNALLTLHQVKWPQNTLLVSNARQVLANLPVADTTFLELQGHFPGKTTINTQNNIPGLDLQRILIPKFYTSGNFKTVYNQMIPNIQNVLTKDHWIIGQDKISLLTGAAREQLINELRELYVHYYSQNWLKIINHVALTQTNDFNNIHNMINMVTDPNSSLNKLLKIVIGNATLSEQTKKTTDKNFQALLAFTQQKGIYNNVVNTLKSLNAYIGQAANATDVNQQSYKLAVIRFTHPDSNDPIDATFLLAKPLPKPLAGWLNTLALSSWQALLAHAKAYLNTIWQAKVAPEYQAQINNRYPIFKTAKMSIELKNFTHFFGPEGTIGNFFNQYLKPFVNTNEAYWTWNKMDGLHINIAQITLDMLIRASLIQQMFFTDNPKSPSFKFTLSLIGLAPTVQSFIINMGGQVLSSAPGFAVKTTFKWPGKNPTHSIIRFNTDAKSQSSMSTTGVWSWFKMLDQYAEITPSKNPKLFVLTFRTQNIYASYQLLADQKVNPFISGVIQNFRLPEKL